MKKKTLLQVRAVFLGICTVVYLVFAVLPPHNIAATLFLLALAAFCAYRLYAVVKVLSTFSPAR